MTPSDWLSIVLTLLSVFVGTCVSWVFFRTQLIADFASLRTLVLDKLTAIHNTELELAAKIDTAERLEKHDDLASIRETVNRIDSRLHESVGSIVTNVKEQQRELAEKIQQQFEIQSKEATRIVNASFSKEVREYISDSRKQEKLLKSLVETFMDSIRVMGDYQRKKLEEQSTLSLESIEKGITSSIGRVLKEVVELKDQLPRLPLETTDTDGSHTIGEDAPELLL